MAYNIEIIDALRTLPDFGTTGGLQKRVALWPQNDFLFNAGADKELLAKKLGFISVNHGWFKANPPMMRELVQICQRTGAKLWIRVPPYGASNPTLDLYKYCTDNNLQYFTYNSKRYWFRCGDPRLNPPCVAAWIADVNQESATMVAVLNGTNVQIVYHVDFENWESDSGGMSTLPEPLRAAIREKAWLAANALRAGTQSGIQNWNDKWGIRDRGPIGWQHSTMYPRPVATCPGDCVSTLMFLPGEPSHWEEVAKRTLALMRQDPATNGLPWVWTCGLGVTGRAVRNFSVPTPIAGYVWGEQFACAYHPERSWLLGLKLSGRQNLPRWAWAKKISWVEFEYSILDPAAKEAIAAAGGWTLKQHWECFLAGMIGKVCPIM